MDKSLDTLRIYTEKPRWQTLSVISIGLLGSVTAELILTGSPASTIDSPGLSNQMIGRVVTALISFFVILPGKQRFQQLNQGAATLLLLCVLILSFTLILFTTNPILFLFGRFLLGIMAGIFTLIAVKHVKMMGADKLITKSFSVIFIRLFLVLGMVVALGPTFGQLFGPKIFGLLLCALMVLAIFFQLIGASTEKLQHSFDSTISRSFWSKPANRIATLVVVLLFGSQYGFMIYLSDFVTVVAGPRYGQAPVFLMTFVIFNFLGAWLDPLIFRNNPYSKLVILPVIMACVLWAMVFNNQLLWLTYVLIIILGFFNGPFAISWSRWFSQNFSANGSLFLFAVMQLSIVFGSVAGGILVNIGGPKAILAFSGVILMAVPVCIILFCYAPGSANHDVVPTDENYESA